MNNKASLNGCKNLKINNKNRDKSVEKLTSGYRINRAADDAAGIAISEKMRSQISGLYQASINSQDGISLSQTIEGATVEVHSMLRRIKELAVQSANGTYSDEDRNLINGEVKQLKSEINRIAEETEFNDKKVLNGTYGSGKEQLALQVGEDKDFKIVFSPLESIACDSLGIDMVDVSTKENAQECISSINNAIDSVSKIRIQVGSIQNRLEHSIKSVDNADENITASESRIRDTNMAYESMENIKSSILIDSTGSLMVQSNHNPEYVLKLLNS